MFANPFSDAELAGRVEAVRKEMSARELDLLLLSAPENIFYLSGLDHWRVPAGFVFRRAGWFAILAALVVPTTLTLLMPIAALLALTLRASGASSRNAGGGRRALAR